MDDKSTEVAILGASASVMAVGLVVIEDLRSHRKRNRGEDDTFDKLSEQIGEVATEIKKLSDDLLDVNKLYKEIMKIEGRDEVMLTTTFDYLVEKEKQAKAFMAKNDRLRRVWSEDTLRKNA